MIQKPSEISNTYWGKCLKCKTIYAEVQGISACKIYTCKEGSVGISIPLEIINKMERELDYIEYLDYLMKEACREHCEYFNK